MYRSLNPKFDKNDKFNAGMRELELGLLSICCFHFENDDDDDIEIELSYN